MTDEDTIKACLIGLNYKLFPIAVAIFEFENERKTEEG